jgi:heme A synthase
VVVVWVLCLLLACRPLPSCHLYTRIPDSARDHNLAFKDAFENQVLDQLSHREGSPIYLLVAVLRFGWTDLAYLLFLYFIGCATSYVSIPIVRWGFPSSSPIFSYFVASAVLFWQRVRCFPLRLVLVKAQPTFVFHDGGNLSVIQGWCQA